jgi:Sec-independent protein secretion pathway component TatC
VRRYRNLIIGVALLFAAIILPFALLVSQRFFVLLLLVLGSWAFYARPFLRRRAQRKLSERPTWTLRPE